MRNINKVILIGNLTRDPEMKRTANEHNITTFGMATNREWATKDGRKQQSAEFHDVVCFGHLAEFANQHLKKGKLVYVEGYLKTRSWDDATGVKKFRTEIAAEDLVILSKRDKNDTQNDAQDDAQNDTQSSADNNKPSQPAVTIEDPLAI